MSDVGRLISWLRGQDCLLEEGLRADELDGAEARFDVRFPSVWREVLSKAHPVSSTSPRGPGFTYPDWRLRDEQRTRDLIDAPVRGLLFDVEHNDFWWHDWGERPDTTAERLAVAADRLAVVPRLVPLWGHLYVASTDDSPVFDIVQADLYVPALTLLDLPGGQDQGSVPLRDWPIGSVPFWSDLHAYSQLGPQGPFAHLGTGGL